MRTAGYIGLLYLTMYGVLQLWVFGPSKGEQIYREIK